MSSHGGAADSSGGAVSLSSAAMSIASGKECILQLVEKLDGIVASDGSMLTSDLSSEL